MRENRTQKWKISRLESKIDRLELENKRLKQVLKREVFSHGSRAVYIQRRCGRGIL